MSRTAATRVAYRRWFLLDGVVSGLNGVAYLALASMLPNLLGGDAALYVIAGIVLIVVTVGLLVVARAARRPSTLPGLLVIINALWAIGSFAVVVAEPFGLTLVGALWCIAQGAIVLAFAILQLLSLRRDGPAV
ncbi:hypothetical protein [Agrococcus baldri]|uniref:Integral membrane protein n=1 Tax=Agrococcus baldri TaxID=153730 RepID=A0AA87URC4_9MICO|nr:hypothetical protein [Agrococcus baldri]GEK79424.1 hypothetical protein ABA31_07750 [Agrococcus baldri]